MDAHRRIRVNSETGKLRRVIMHTPGNEHSRIRPSEISKFLIEDILSLPEAREEHRIFQTLLASFGVQILEFQTLLTSTLADDERNRRALEQKYVTHDRSRTRRFFSDREFAEFLVVGEADHDGVMPVEPLPNLLFVRDIGVVIGSHVLLGHMTEQVRKREGELFAAIARVHPEFQGLTVLNPTDEPLEGGDVCVVRDDLAVIGYGHRTKTQTIEPLARTLLENGIATVIAVKLPDERAHMHLDTVFTIISDDEALVYAPVILGERDRLGSHAPVTVYRKSADVEAEPFPGTLLDCLADHGVHLTPIICGCERGSAAEREQWWDGCNALAIAPGTAVLYKRNTETLEALRHHGYRIEPILTLKDAERARNGGKVVFAIDGRELSRGRGGPHCMTLPIERD